MIRRFESVSKWAYLSKVATSLWYLYDDINTLKISDFVGFSARIEKEEAWVKDERHPES